MANYINKERRQIDFDPFDLRIIAVPEVVAVQFKPRSEHTLLIRIADVGATYQPLKTNHFLKLFCPFTLMILTKKMITGGLVTKSKRR